jgi:hypothetical protein
MSYKVAWCASVALGAYDPVLVRHMKQSFLAIVVLLLCVACQMDKRFSQLQTGMTKAQVMQIVAKKPTGHKTQGEVEILQWETGSHYAKFKNGRLIDYGTE